MTPTTTVSESPVHVSVSVAPRTLRRALALIRKRAAREPRVNKLTGYSEMPGELSIRNLDLARRLGRTSEKTGRRIIAALVEIGCIAARAVLLGYGKGGFMVLELRQLGWTNRVDIPNRECPGKDFDVVSDFAVGGGKISRRSTATTTTAPLPETPRTTPQVLTDDQQAVMAHYSKRFQEKRGCKPPLPGPWVALLAGKVTEHGREQATGCVDRAFESQTWIAATNYHIPVLMHAWDELAPKPRPAPPRPWVEPPVPEAEVERRRGFLINVGVRGIATMTGAEVLKAYEKWMAEGRAR